MKSLSTNTLAALVTRVRNDATLQTCLKQKNRGSRQALRTEGPHHRSSTLSFLKIGEKDNLSVVGDDNYEEVVSSQCNSETYTIKNSGWRL